MAILVLLNNFMHDFSAAGWLFGTVILWLILKKSIHDADGIIADLLDTVLLLMRLCLGGIVIFGVIRALAYKQYEWSAAAGQGQVTLLVVKHILFLGIFVPGIVYYTKAKKHLKKVHNEKTK